MSIWEFISEYAELIVAISSIIIALTALGVSIWQGILTRKHNKLSVLPSLTILVIRSTINKKYGLRLVNGGNGPARIKSVQFFFDNNKIDNANFDIMKEVMRAAFQSPGKPVFEFMDFDKDMFVLPGRELDFIDLKLPQDIELNEEDFRKSANRIGVKIKYESIYNDSFVCATDGID